MPYTQTCYGMVINNAINMPNKGVINMFKGIETQQAELSLDELTQVNHAIWGISTDIEHDFVLTDVNELNFEE
jgi:hypothetical protein